MTNKTIPYISIFLLFLFVFSNCCSSGIFSDDEKSVSIHDDKPDNRQRYSNENNDFYMNLYHYEISICRSRNIISDPQFDYL